MKNRVRLVLTSAVFAVSCVGLAAAEDTFQSSASHSFSYCRSGPVGGCARFQGYIYVRRGAAADGETHAAPFASAVAEGRLYVHAGAHLEDR